MKNKLNFRGKVILCFIMIVYTILYGVNAYSSNSLTGSYNCYQNLANISTSCGGLNTGTYLNPGLWSDGDFVTYSILDGSSDWEVNYYKNTSFTGAIVNTERYSGSGYAYYNYTIPSSCFNAYTDKINLKFYRGSSGSFYTIEGACWNGNSYTSLFSDTGKTNLAEVSMYWDLNTTTENLTFINNSNITRYLSIPSNTVLTNGYLTLTDNTNYGNGADGAVSFTTGAKSYGNLVNNVDYTVSGNTLYLMLNRPYNFTNFTLGAGTTLSTLNTTGAVLYLSATGNITIDGTVNLTGFNNQSSIYSYNSMTFNSPQVRAGGSGGSAYNVGSAAQGNGYGGGGAGGSMNAGAGKHGGSGGTGGNPIESGGASVHNAGVSQSYGNNGGTSAGGSGSVGSNFASGSQDSGAGAGGSYGATGSAGTCSETGLAGGGGGSGGKAGTSGMNIYIAARIISFNGIINVSGTSGTNGGNGGAGSSLCQSGAAGPGAGGGGGGGGDGGNITLYSNQLTNSGTTILTNGSFGIGGVIGSYTSTPFGSTNGNNGTAGKSGTLIINITNFNFAIDSNTPINITTSPMTTSNLASSINSYLSTCSYSNGFCQVPLVFHSDTAGILQYSNLNFNNSGFTQNSITYDSTTSGGSTETFTLNLTYDTYNTNSVLANLIYNNTAYSTVITNYGSYQLATSTIPIPRVNSQTNKSFYFSITLNGIVYNSSTNNQTINTFTIDNCSTNTLNIMNISMVDEETLNPINGTIEGLFNIYSLNTNNLITTLNQTFNYVIGTPTRICLTNFTSNYSMSYQLRFYGNSSYFKRYKVIQNQVLSNTTFNNLILYNLLTSMGYPFTITVTGNLQTTNGNTGLLVDAQRQYFSSNSYNSVESQVTDNNGIAIINLVPNNVIYNFVVSYNNQILGTFNNYQVQCSNPSIGQCTLILNLGQAQATIPNYQNYGNIEGSYYLNSNTSTLFFQFNSIDGNSHNINQSVIEFDGYGNTTICSNYASGTSGTLICNIPTLYQNTTFYSVIYSDGVYIGTNYFTLGQTMNYYGVDIFIELLMFSSIVMLMLANPILMVIGTVLGFASGLTLLWVTGGSWQSILGVVIAFAIGGMIIIWKIGRKI